MTEPQSSATPTQRFRRPIAIVLACYWTALLVSTHVPLPEETFSGGSDKLAHFAGYALLAFLFGLWVSSDREMTARSYAWVFGVTIAYGIVDEMLQAPVGRDPELADVLADGIGSGVGLAALFVTLRVWDRFRSSA